MKKTSDLIWQDKQHQVLFVLIDQLETGHGDTSVFRRLNDYAENHFLLEEEYMIKLEFPHYEAHKAQHDKFRTELDLMTRECHTYDIKFCAALSEFLRGWLSSHIFGIDKVLESFILQSDAK
jgi:hemerythrin